MIILSRCPGVSRGALAVLFRHGIRPGDARPDGRHSARSRGYTRLIGGSLTLLLLLLPAACGLKHPRWNPIPKSDYKRIRRCAQVMVDSLLLMESLREGVLYLDEDPSCENRLGSDLLDELDVRLSTGTYAGGVEKRFVYLPRAVRATPDRSGGVFARITHELKLKILPVGDDLVLQLTGTPQRRGSRPIRLEQTLEGSDWLRNEFEAPPLNSLEDPLESMAAAAKEVARDLCSSKAAFLALQEEGTSVAPDLDRYTYVLGDPRPIQGTPASEEWEEWEAHWHQYLVNYIGCFEIVPSERDRKEVVQKLDSLFLEDHTPETIDPNLVDEGLVYIQTNYMIDLDHPEILVVSVNGVFIAPETGFVRASMFRKQVCIALGSRTCEHNASATGNDESICLKTAAFRLLMKAVDQNPEIHIDQDRSEAFMVYDRVEELSSGTRVFLDFLRSVFKGTKKGTIKTVVESGTSDGKKRREYECVAWGCGDVGQGQWNHLAEAFAGFAGEQLKEERERVEEMIGDPDRIGSALTRLDESIRFGEELLGIFVGGRQGPIVVTEPIRSELRRLKEIHRKFFFQAEMNPKRAELTLTVDPAGRVLDKLTTTVTMYLGGGEQKPLEGVAIRWTVDGGGIRFQQEVTITDVAGKATARIDSVDRSLLDNPIPILVTARLAHGGDDEDFSEFEIRFRTGEPPPKLTKLIWIEPPTSPYLCGTETPPEENPAGHMPATLVTIEPFLIEEREVANAQYMVFVIETGRRQPRFWYDGRYNNPEKPVVGVSWQDALAYCSWCDRRLPTECEWELAARGRIRFLYPWGNDGDGQPGLGGGGLRPVRSRVGDKSPFGVYDMAGNVREWCSDDYALPGDLNDILPAGSRKVVRGGDFRCDSGGWILTSRLGQNPEGRYDNVGFRCAANSREAGR